MSSWVDGAVSCLGRYFYFELPYAHSAGKLIRLLITGFKTVMA